MKIDIEKTNEMKKKILDIVNKLNEPINMTIYELIELEN